LKYRFEGKEKVLSLGKYPEVSLADVRKKREDIKAKVASGIDTAANKKAKKKELASEILKNKNTFEHVSTAYLEKRNELNEAYKIRLERSFKNDVFKFIGNDPIEDIKPKQIIDIVKRVEERGAVESAHRLFTQISKVFKYAVSNQIVERNPCSEMDKGEILKSHTRKNYPTITDPKEIKLLLKAIDEFTGHYTTKMALKLAPYVFVRPFNLRHAEWNEIDLDARLWRIPAEKMKTKKEQIVPLTDTTVSIFQEMKVFSGNAKYIFHSLRSVVSPMSDATLNNALRRMGYSKDEMVTHSFRAMFSTIAHEKSDFKHEVIETQLAHTVGTDVSRAYNRALYLAERKELMYWWSDYLDGVKNS
jgi:integrase